MQARLRALAKAYANRYAQPAPAPRSLSRRLKCLLPGRVCRRPLEARIGSLEAQLRAAVEERTEWQGRFHELSLRTRQLETLLANQPARKDALPPAAPPPPTAPHTVGRASRQRTGSGHVGEMVDRLSVHSSRHASRAESPAGRDSGGAPTPDIRSLQVGKSQISRSMLRLGVGIARVGAVQSIRLPAPTPDIRSLQVGKSQTSRSMLHAAPGFVGRHAFGFFVTRSSCLPITNSMSSAD